MKEIWTLIIKTALPKVCPNASAIKTEVIAFENFEDARVLLREKLRDFAFSKNAMFNGKGQIKQINKYVRDMIEDEELEEYDDFLTKKMMMDITGALYEVFSGNDVDLKIKRGKYSDGMIAFEYKNGAIRFLGDDDGPINGYDPTLFTNMFDMSEEKDYYLYIDDALGQDDCTSELYIDLKKTVLN